MTMHVQKALKPSRLEVILLAIFTGHREKEIVNLCYRHLLTENNKEAGNRKSFRFPFPEATGGSNGE